MGNTTEPSDLVFVLEVVFERVSPERGKFWTVPRKRNVTITTTESSFVADIEKVLRTFAVQYASSEDEVSPITAVKATGIYQYKLNDGMYDWRYTFQMQRPPGGWEV